MALRQTCRVIPILVAAWLPLAAQTRHSRTFGADEGLIPAFVVSLAQDSTGLLWIGTGGGLYRYDGVTMRRWAPDSLQSWVSTISVSPAGAIVVSEEQRGGVYRVTSAGVTPVRGPGGEPLDSAVSVTFDRAGGLWVARRDELLYRAPEGSWRVHPRSMLGDAPLRRVVASPQNGALVVTHAAVWQVQADSALVPLLEIENPVDVLPAADGRLFVATFAGRVGLVENGRFNHLVSYPNRAISLALRGRSLWIAFDHHLISLEPGHEPELLALEDGVVSGGPLLVDHEGSLWLGTSGGLLQFPEPDTRIWTERHGLPSRHTRFLARTGDTVWIATWRGSAGLAPRDGAWRLVTPQAWSTVSRIVVGPEGELWAASSRPEPGIYSIRDGRPRLLDAQATALYGLALDPGGRAWLASNAGLLVATPGQSSLVREGGLPFSNGVMVQAVLIDRARRAWVASNRRVCHATLAPASVMTEWICGDIPDGHHVNAFAQMPSGAVWATMTRGGVWRYADSSWEALPGVRRLAARDMQNLVPSRDGGLWLVGVGSVIRVHEDPQAEAGWREAERIVAWHGLHNDGVTDLLEDGDGSLWLTTTGGLVHIPADARRARPAPPRVVLGEALVDGVQVPIDTRLELPHDRNRMELRFAAISYRDPALLRYEVRLSPGDPWDRVQGEPVFRWVDLRPGSYHAEVRASLDGATWTAHPARFDFQVLRPWYRSPWAISALGLLLAGTLAVIYRARVAFLLELERQRTRIAMDLHDEMGSGLGSIGILSSMLSSGRVERGEDVRLAGEIARTAGELGTALSGIVWSLTPRAGTVEEMAGRLAEHGRRLLVGGSAEFVTSFPDTWPETPLRPAVRRNALLIVLEALHNAARHARADKVELRIVCDGPEWAIVVTDDGGGMNGLESRSSRGLGIASMRERAAEIGAVLEVQSATGRGTVVRLRFDPRGRSRRFGWLTRRSRVA